MFTFSMVRRIGEGKYLSDDCFIIERIRRERALNMHMLEVKCKKRKANKPGTNGKPAPS